MSACSGAVHSPSGPADRGGSSSVRGSDEPGAKSAAETYFPARVRLLNPVEYTNTVAELVGVEGAGAMLPSPDRQNGYTNNAAQTISALSAEAFASEAERIAADARTHLKDLLPCTEALGPRNCAHLFVTTFGRRAFRRPVSPDEVTDLIALFDMGYAGGSFEEGIALMIEAMLQSPSFLYVTELGEAVVPQTGRIQLTPWEVASALSYLVLASPPDETLLTAAEADQLSTPEEIESQVRRLLNDPRARTQLRRFAFEWLGIANVSMVSRDASAFPLFTENVRQMLLAETGALFEDVVFHGDGSFAALMTAQYTFADKELAALYGASAKSVGKLERITLPKGQRSGLLTQASVLATYSHANETSPVRRGVFLMRKILCQALPSPPQGLVIVVPEQDPNQKLTTRELFKQHVSSPTCSACHRLIDPPGNLFEEYDAIGQFRTEDNGAPVNSADTIAGTSDFAGTFSNAASWVQVLAASQEATTCFARNFFRFASAQSDAAVEASFDRVLEKAAPDGLLEILVAYTKSKLFSTRGGQL